MLGNSFPVLGKSLPMLGKPVSHVRELASHARKLISHPRKLISHPRKLISHARKVISHARKVISQPGPPRNTPCNPRLSNGPKQLARRRPERVCQLHDRRQFHVARAALDVADLERIHPRRLGELLQRPLPRLTPLAKTPPECDRFRQPVSLRARRHGLT